MKTRTILLYGQSMLLSLVADSLAQSADLQVVHAADWEEVNTLVVDYIPDVLIYDLAAVFESHILSLLFVNPLLLLIGLDVETNRAVLMGGKETRFLTLERMKEIVTTC